MTAYEIWQEALITGFTTREKIDQYFNWVASADLTDQIALELTPDDFGNQYTNISNEIVRIEDQ